MSLALFPTVVALLFVLALTCSMVRGEDGYKLWLRYAGPVDAAKLAAYRQAVSSLVIMGKSPTFTCIGEELQAGLGSMLGHQLKHTEAKDAKAGAVIVGTPATSPVISADRSIPDKLKTLGPEGYIIRTADIPGGRAIFIAANTNVGCLYGMFHFLRLLQTGQSIDHLDIREKPRISRRIVNHWDNLNGSIERGYAGTSLWKWEELPAKIDPRYKDYARAQAFLGINGVVLNNVNANARFITPEYLEKIVVLADIFRPWGITTYLSINFNSPRTIGGLATGDPLDPAVQAWWKAKVSEIYKLIPDFGGFLVKANSEGQPGPQSYGRTHADGANMIADALAPHHGIVMWRAFVYEESVDPDRIKRAFMEFVPLDGKFRSNVIVQIKNGPLDFQPREPFSPLFGATPRTPQMMEFQIAQEYFGKSTHWVYLAPMWKECLDADTYVTSPLRERSVALERPGEGGASRNQQANSASSHSTVAHVIDGSLHGHALTAIAAVTNTGSDRNWTGHDFHQANWYAYGRLTWNPNDSAERIADDWLRMTYSTDQATLDTIKKMMMQSWEMYISYYSPLGLTHLQGNPREGPDPGWTAEPHEDWNPPYYHRAAADGIGFDRSSKTGSNGVGQYNSPLREMYDNLATCPENLLLWFHHVPWTHMMKSGRTLWDEICFHYNDGHEKAKAMEATWKSLEGKIDPDRFQAVSARLAKQVADTKVWRDRALNYFQQKSGMKIAVSQ